MVPELIFKILHTAFVSPCLRIGYNPSLNDIIKLFPGMSRVEIALPTRKYSIINSWGGLAGTLVAAFFFCPPHPYKAKV